MTIQQLKYIIALNKERHFARAAELCFVSQPALTSQLKALEEEIGIKIFDRSVVPMKPTLLGETIIAKAKKVLQEVDSIQNFVIDEKNILSGSIRLGIIATLSPYLIPLLIAEFKTQLPNIRFEIREAPTGMLIKELEEGDLDIAIMATPTGNKTLKEFPVFYEPFVAYLNTQLPENKTTLFKISDIDKSSLLLLQHEYCYNAQLLDMCNLKNYEKINDSFSYNVSSIETLKYLVKAGLGFAIIPELSILQEVNNGQYQYFEEPQPVREISMVVNDTFARNLLLQTIKLIVLKCLPEKLTATTNQRIIRWNDSPYFRKAMASPFGSI